MAKLKTDPITQADLAKFAINDSDFAFEMRVLHELRDLGFQCEHSGTYEDPVTHKFRQFDIRAHQSIGEKVLLALAVECKNIRPYDPLLLTAVPRTEAESFHERIEYTTSQYGHGSSQSIRVQGRMYPVGDSVGKKTDQVGREDKRDELVSDDSVIFEKLNQAMNSCRDLVSHYGWTSDKPYWRVIMPVLVVPDGVLWQIDYTAEGTTKEPLLPCLVPATTLFQGRTWEFDRGDRLLVPYGISHLEIWTPAGLGDRIAVLSNLLL